MDRTLISRRDRPVANWIFIGVGMLIIQIILGGITRLTGSGLSITEWDVITGTLPPLSEAQWLQEFDKYRQTPQFRLLNSDFDLHDFKFIFFWEWFHRFWGRLIGIAFAIPFVVFLIQKRFRKEMVGPLLLLFVLGALQGLVGWVMVASGLTGDAVYVKPTRLAAHFLMAALLIGYALWFGLQLAVPGEQRLHRPAVRSFTWWIIAVLGIQFIFGALMAGHRAAPAAPTWPDINGSFIPAVVTNSPEGWAGIVENRIIIHFIHRTLAYALVVLIIIWTLKALKVQGSSYFRKWRLVPLALVFVQLCLGIATVLTATGIRATVWNRFEWMAQLHQVVAILLLLSLMAVLYGVSGKRPGAAR